MLGSQLCGFPGFGTLKKTHFSIDLILDESFISNKRHQCLIHKFYNNNNTFFFKLMESYEICFSHKREFYKTWTSILSRHGLMHDGKLQCFNSYAEVSL